MLSLKDKAFVEGFYDLFWLSIVLVIPAVFLGQVCVDRVVEIVAPDGVQSESALASRQNQTTIVLVDGAQLAELMIDHDVGVNTVKRLDVKRVDSDYFEAAS